MPLEQDTSRENAGADGQLIQKPRRTWMILAGLLTVHSGLLAYSSCVHSPTLDEPGHLAAGISHWQFGEFELYRVNPPLVRMIAALPVLAAGVETDWSNFHEGPGARPVFLIGANLIVANGERSFSLLMIARWACIPFSWIGAVVCFLWARDLYGNRAGVLAMTLWCFSPNILAHASLITADAPATALGLAACYTFWRWLRRPTWQSTVLTGVVLGVAELTKSTLVILYPLWPLLWILYRLPERASMKTGDWLREGAMLVARIVIGIYVINFGYGFEDSGKPLGEFQFVSNTFTGEESGAVGNRFAETWLTDVPVPFPKNYILGIDIQRRDFENYGRPSYLSGKWRDHGWWCYYLYALAIKVPLGTWVLLLLVIAHHLFRRQPVPGPAPCSIPHCAIPNPQPRDELVLLFPAIMILTFVSSQSEFSEHMRYALPCLPFVFVWIGSLGNSLARSVNKLPNAAAKRDVVYVGFPQVGGQAKERKPRKLLETRQTWSFCRSCLATVVAVVALVWSVGSSLWMYPHSLAYFNEAIGGPRNGGDHLLGSNIDWGQDLFYVRDWLDEPPGMKFDGLVFSGTYPVALAGISETPHPPSAAEGPTPGWHALSVNYLYDRSQQYRYFLRFEPVAMAGYSIYIYHITLDDANRVRRELGLPELAADWRREKERGATGQR